jgi:nucleoid-associated protein YgaU
MATRYQAAPGDTLRSVALAFYGDAAMSAALAAANGMTGCGQLADGQDLVIPYITQRHTVGVGETLFELAELYYGNGAMFPVLAAANHIEPPYLTVPGHRLLIPDLVHVSRHTVYPGDNLRTFALRWYNDEQCYPIIEYANHLAAPTDIEVGQVLVRPGLNRRHTVEPGETWTQLSQWWYGDPSLAALIAVANDLVIEQVPPAGRTLYFPDLAEF